MPKKKIVIYWSRRDFRLRDNTALSAVIKNSQDGLFAPLFIVEPYMTQADPTYQFGMPSRWALSQMVPQFAKNFKTFFTTHDNPSHFFKKLHTKVSKEFELEIFVNEDVHPDFYSQLKKIQSIGYTVHVCRDQLTINRNTKTSTGNIYSIFTPFKRAVWTSFVQEKESERVTEKQINSMKYFNLSDYVNVDVNTCTSLNSLATNKESIKVGKHTFDLTLLKLPSRDLSIWYTDEQSALDIFKKYLRKNMDSYKNTRDSLELDATSKMSTALTWGLISARTMMVLIREHFKDVFENPFSTQASEGAIHYISELIWREFYKYLYLHYPNLINQEFQEKFRGTIEWADDHTAKERFTAWMKGQTGYKIVDAAMMQLAKTGWMHNRARMIVASVLTKNLGVDWRWGQEYFRAMLIDIDEASNCGGWQWGASVGADPKPIRIFNPHLQTETRDPEGVYQKKWLSEDRWLQDVEPIVPHKEARDEALKRYGLSRDGEHRKIAMRDF